MRAELTDLFYNAVKQDISKTQFLFAGTFDRLGNLTKLAQAARQKRTFSLQQRMQITLQLLSAWTPPVVLTKNLPASGAINH